MPLYLAPGLVKIGEAVGTGASGTLEVVVPASYSELQISWVGRSDAAGTAGAGARLTFETSPTAGAYDYEQLGAAATTATAVEVLGTVDAITVGAVPTAGNTANLVSSGKVWIPGYAGSGWKVATAGGGAAIDITTGTLGVRAVAGVFESTGAIARVRLTLSTGNWTAVSKLVVYGLL